jgi:hypothetical protein
VELEKLWMHTQMLWVRESLSDTTSQDVFLLSEGTLFLVEEGKKYCCYVKENRKQLYRSVDMSNLLLAVLVDAPYYYYFYSQTNNREFHEQINYFKFHKTK